MFTITAKMIPNKDKLGIRDMYNPYKWVQQSNDEKFVTIEVYIKVLCDFLLFIKDLLLHGRMVTLGANLGTICILGKKPKIQFDDKGRPKLPPDWGATKKLWAENEEHKKKKTLIFHFNEETNFVRYKVHWSKTNVLLDNKDYYSFIAAFHFRREIASNIKKGGEYLIQSPKKNYEQV